MGPLTRARHHRAGRRGRVLVCPRSAEVNSAVRSAWASEPRGRRGAEQQTQRWRR